MSKVKLLTQAEYAKHRGCSQVAVHKAVKAGRISLINDRIDPAVADIQWAQNTRARATVKPPASVASVGDVAPPPGTPRDEARADEPRAGDDGYWSARVRREKAEAEAAELNTAKLAGTLISVDAVKAVLGNAYVVTREAILNIPARIAAQLAAETDAGAIQSALHTELHRALTTLADAPGKVGGATTPTAEEALAE